MDGSRFGSQKAMADQHPVSVISNVNCSNYHKFDQYLLYLKRDCAFLSINMISYKYLLQMSNAVIADTDVLDQAFLLQPNECSPLL